MTILEVELMTAVAGLLSDIEHLRRDNEPITGPLPFEEQASVALVRARMRHLEDLNRRIATPQDMEKMYDKTCNKAASSGGSKILYPNSACADHD